MSHYDGYEEQLDDMGYDFGMDDKRLSQVSKGEDQALKEVDQTYEGMIDQSDKFFQDQINANEEWSQTQQKNQQDQTDFAIEQVEQQKDQAEKDYTREQAGAYADWQKQSNQYGAKAEQMAAQGLGRTGYTESSQVSMYNTYQNRVSRAKEAYGRAVQDYNNMITQARLQNNSALAEIAYKALQQRLELALNGFQYKNSLILDRFNQKTTIRNNYWGRYTDVLNQINTENALAEQIRQFNFINKLGEFAEEAPSGGGGGSGGSGGSRNPKPNPDPGDQLKGPSLTELVNAGALTPQQAVEAATGKTPAQIKQEIEAKNPPKPFTK